MFFLCGAICLAILLYHSIDQMPQPNGWYSFVRCLSRVRVRACVRATLPEFRGLLVLSAINYSCGE